MQTYQISSVLGAQNKNWRRTPRFHASFPAIEATVGQYMQILHDEAEKDGFPCQRPEDGDGEPREPAKDVSLAPQKSLHHKTEQLCRSEAS